jgi:hypothetical protein
MSEQIMTKQRLTWFFIGPGNRHHRVSPVTEGASEEEKSR